MATTENQENTIVKMRFDVPHHLYKKFTEYQLRMSVRLKRRINQDQAMEEILQKLKG